MDRSTIRGASALAVPWRAARSMRVVPEVAIRLFGSNLTQDPRDWLFFAHRFRQPKNGTNRTSKEGFVRRKGVGPCGGAVVVPRGPFHERPMTIVHVATGKNSFAVESPLALAKPSNPYFAGKEEEDLERVAERGSRFPRSRSAREDPALEGGEIALEEGASILGRPLGLVRGIGGQVVVVVRVEVRDSKPSRERSRERRLSNARCADDVDAVRAHQRRVADLAQPDLSSGCRDCTGATR